MTLRQPEASGVEDEVAGLWGKILKRRTVPAGATFLEAGGDSLLLLALLGEIEERFGVFLEAEDIVEDLTVAGISRAVENALAGA